MKTVFIAGATGYLGQYLCAEYHNQGWRVVALVRDVRRAINLLADIVIEAEATRPETLAGAMQGVDLVVSALGMTRQTDGVGYWDVDYQANINLLNEAQRSSVRRFGYIHVLNGDQMPLVPPVAAKNAFVRKLQLAPIRSTVIAPSGYFSDMADIMDMARNGRIWLFGSGRQRLNPIHGADLAAATFRAIDAGMPWRDVGGPDTFTQNDLARLCFQILNKPDRTVHLPDVLRRAILRIVPKIARRSVAGPVQFFLTALSMDMVGDSFGTHRLEDHFKRLVSDADP
ncbi:MAG: SDR family oxidoreductase [Roseobacter sp.]